MGKAKQKSAITYRPATPWEKAKAEKEAAAKAAKQKSTSAATKSDSSAADDGGMEVEKSLDELIAEKPSSAADTNADDEDAPASDDTPASLKVKKKVLKKRKEKGLAFANKLEAKAEKLQERRLSKLKRKTMWD